MIVVEGKSDTVKIKEAVHADTIETNGSAINDETLQLIKHAKEKRGIIIFTDPDYPGTRIRHIIDNAVPGCKHAFLTVDEATSKRNKHTSLGIEHATTDAIKEALEKAYVTYENHHKFISKTDLLSYQLIGHPNSRERRERLGDHLSIGYTNGKQLLKRLNMFNIMKSELDEAMKYIIEEERRKQ